MKHLASPSIIKEILRAHKIRPAHGLGQNFLADQNVLDKIVKASELKKTDVILEIGPGLGVLTTEIAQYVKKVVAVELDPIMVDISKATVSHQKNVEVVHGDILSADLTALGLKDLAYKVVSNLPYQITSPILRVLIGESPRPSDIYLTIQKEVAERITNQPPDANLLSNFVQYYSKPKILFTISPGSFWPQPEIDSSFIKISDVSDGKFPLNSEEQQIFFKLIKAGFSAKRKQLINTLSHGLTIEKSTVSEELSAINIDPTRRAETLSLDEWYSIYKILGIN